MFGADDHDLFRHVAVAISGHRAHMHGAPAAQVHDLHERRIVGRGPVHRDGHGRPGAVARDGDRMVGGGLGAAPAVICCLCGLHGDRRLLGHGRPGCRRKPSRRCIEPCLIDRGIHCGDRAAGCHRDRAVIAAGRARERHVAVVHRPARWNLIGHYATAGVGNCALTTDGASFLRTQAARGPGPVGPPIDGMDAAAWQGTDRG